MSMAERDSFELPHRAVITPEPERLGFQFRLKRQTGQRIPEKRSRNQISIQHRHHQNRWHCAHCGMLAHAIGDDAPGSGWHRPQSHRGTCRSCKRNVRCWRDAPACIRQHPEEGRHNHPNGLIDQRLRMLNTHADGKGFRSSATPVSSSMAKVSRAECPGASTTCCRPYCRQPFADRIRHGLP